MYEPDPDYEPDYPVNDFDEIDINEVLKSLDAADHH